MMPPRRILAAVDFSDGSRVALTAAAGLARQCGATLVVLHALDPLLHDAARVEGIDLAGESDAELKRFIDAAAGPAAICERIVVSGKAAEVICCIAARENADMIAVGAHGMSGLAHVMFGSTTERVLRQASVSVFVVPATWASPSGTTDVTGLGPVIAGIDLTDEPAATAAAALDLARLLHTSLELRHVIAPLTVPERWRAHASRATAAATSQAQAELDILLRGLKADVPVTAHLDTGDVATTLAHAATAAGGRRPLLVLGRNPERVRGTVPGAIAYRVLTQASAPVLVFLPPT